MYCLKLSIHYALLQEPLELFHDGGSYHIETSPLICRANQWTGFYMIGTSAMKELNTDSRDTLMIKINSARQI